LLPVSGEHPEETSAMNDADETAKTPTTDCKNDLRDMSLSLFIIKTSYGGLLISNNDNDSYYYFKYSRG
tara:strand:- start:305 stop:511 length:207 start_codon:yes stop_codon:yes gene_type:complete